MNVQIESDTPSAPAGSRLRGDTPISHMEIFDETVKAVVGVYLNRDHDEIRRALGPDDYVEMLTLAKESVKPAGSPLATRQRRMEAKNAGKYRMRIGEVVEGGQIVTNIVGRDVTIGTFAAGLGNAINDRVVALTNDQYNGTWKILWIRTWRREDSIGLVNETMEKTAPEVRQFMFDKNDDAEGGDRFAKVTPITVQKIGYTLCVVDISGKTDLIYEAGNVAGTEERDTSDIQAAATDRLTAALTRVLEGRASAEPIKTAAPSAEPEDDGDKYPGVPTHDEKGNKIHWQTRKRMFEEGRGK